MGRGALANEIHARCTEAHGGVCRGVQRCTEGSEQVCRGVHVDEWRGVWRCVEVCGAVHGGV